MSDVAKLEGVAAAWAKACEAAMKMVDDGERLAETPQTFVVGAVLAGFSIWLSMNGREPNPETAAEYAKLAFSACSVFAEGAAEGTNRVQ